MSALAALRLARSQGVGPRRFQRLLARFGSADAALDALPRLPGGMRAAPADAVRAEFERGAAMGAQLLILGAAAYPAALAEIPDPPPCLWALGDVGLAARPCVALVGARNASASGRRIAAELAEALGAAGWVVVSGLARGVDAAAHQAALGRGTLACVAGGVDVVYPPENAALTAAITAQGLVLSEAAPGERPVARSFPRRNRLISGVSSGVVLIEAAARSGSLITARCAAEQGREAMAVPGSPRDPRAAGCNALIRDGAALIRDADDVLEALAAPQRRPAPELFAPAPPSPAPEPESLMALVGDAPVHVDALAREAGLSAQALASALLDLELEGLIERRPGDMIARL